MRILAGLCVFLLAACEVKPSFAPPDSPEALQETIRTSYQAAIERVAHPREADKPVNTTERTRDFAMNMFTDGDPAKGLREAAKLKVKEIKGCAWTKMEVDSKEAQLFGVTASHGYLCDLKISIRELKISTCKRAWTDTVLEAYVFLDGNTMRYAPGPRWTFGPFGEDPWHACDGR